MKKEITTVKSKEIYWSSIQSSLSAPTCIKSWNKEFHLEYEEKKWETIFALPFRCVQDLKIRDIQIKILHRIYPTQSLVSKWDKETSEICVACNEYKADIVHTFFSCKLINTLWNTLSHIFEPILSKYTNQINREHVIFGILPYTVGNHCINHCILYCKYFCHIERMNDTAPRACNFIKYYKRILELEKSLYVLQNETHMFLTLFNKLSCILEDYIK